MCGRYTVLTEDEIVEVREILRRISLRLVRDEADADAPTSPEVFPTDCAPILTQEESGTVFERAKWGFQRWDGGGVIINARCEGIRAKSTFSPLLKQGRCVVPAGAFFEWERLGTGKRKHYARDREGNLLFMAGLYRDSVQDDAPQSVVREFVILTKAAVGGLTRIHDRMPALLRVAEIEPWLTGKLTPEALLQTNYDLQIEPCEQTQLSLF